jgi:PAS domain S-box-containing protein
MKSDDLVAQTRAILDTALDAVITMDAAGRIVYWNQRAESIFGWAPSDAVGRDLTDLIMPARYRDQHRAGLQRFLRTGQRRILGKRIEITALRRDRTQFPVELAVASLGSGDAQFFNAFIADISERKRVETALREGEAQKAALLRLSRRLELSTRRSSGSSGRASASSL